MGREGYGFECFGYILIWVGVRGFCNFAVVKVTGVRCQVDKP